MFQKPTPGYHILFFGRVDQLARSKTRIARPDARKEAPKRRQARAKTGAGGEPSTKYLVELLVSPELEEFGRRVELVGRPDQKRGCDDLGSVFGTLCKI